MVWSATLNTGLSILALLALAGTTVYVALGFAQNAKDKTALRIRRAYFVFLVAIATSMIAASVKGAPTLLCATLFSAAMMAFIPLAFMALDHAFPKQAHIWDIVIWVALAIGVAFFLIGLPTTEMKTSSSGASDDWTGNY